MLGKRLRFTSFPSKLSATVLEFPILRYLACEGTREKKEKKREKRKKNGALSKCALRGEICIRFRRSPDGLEIREARDDRKLSIP